MFEAQNLQMGSTAMNEEEGNLIMVMESINQENIRVLNVHAPNNSFKINEAKTKSNKGIIR